MRRKSILTLFLLFLGSAALGQSSFQIGDSLRVLSDRGIKKTSKKEFEAVGNVVLVSGDITLYGDWASIDFKKNSLKVRRNLRLNSSSFSILGDEISFKFKEGTFKLRNSIVKNKQYNVYGKEIERHSNGDIFLESGTYSTCRECEGSWSIRGEEIRVTPSEYIRIKNAYFFANNSPIFYFPYIIFPIKNKRESGFLAPKFSLSANDGLYFQIPYFFAPSKNFDMTISPGFFGGFGVGANLELRYKSKNNDSIYSEGYLFADNRREDGPPVVYNRSFLSIKLFNKLRLFFEANLFNDYDLYRNFYQFIENNVNSPDIGVSSFLEFENKFFHTSVFISERENLITENRKDKDLDYIQLRPDFNLLFTPIVFYPFRNNVSHLSFDYRLRYSEFRQLKKNIEQLKNFSRFDHELNSTINFLIKGLGNYFSIILLSFKVIRINSIKIWGKFHLFRGLITRLIFLKIMKSQKR